MPLQDQGLQTLRILGEAPSLIIYDNVRSEDSTRPWLPPSGMPCHVVITTVLDRWDGGWSALTVEPLTEPQSLELVEKLAGRELAARHGRKLADIAGGLPAQLVPASVTLAYEARRGRSDAIPTTLQHEATQSFRGTYEQLETPARLLLLSAARLNPQRILRSELQQHLMSAAGWSETEFQRNLDACLDVHVLQGADTLRMHQLFASFLLATDIAPDVADTLSKVEASQIGRVAEIAQELGTAPNRANLAATFMTYPLTNDGWMAPRLSTEDGEAVGRALANVGQFVAAQPWFQRAAAAKEKGAAQGQSDHDSLGSSLHWIGFCLSGTGKFAEAQPWYERAVAAREKGDVQGLIDHDGMSASLHQVGLCLSSTGKFAEAQPWYERAVAAAEKGDRHGQVDHDSIGLSLQEVGWCLSSTGKFAEAQLWFERSVAAREKGDRHGRLNHDGIGLSLHQVGFCLSSAHNYAEARPWFERAVAAREKGDVHGRLDHDGIGRSMHQVGVCISETATFAEAQPWYERAVTAKEKGDVHGRIDHNSLGNSLHSIGFCLSSMQKFVEAQPWYERAVAAREKGDVHGRIDHNSLGITLHLIGFCLFSTQKFAAAQPWFERAAAAKEMGDLYGRRDPASLALTLRSWASCLDKLGVVAEKARELRERAVAINPPAS
jgi:tetratricopeptide (TPR) repeat protein